MITATILKVIAGQTHVKFSAPVSYGSEKSTEFGIVSTGIGQWDIKEVSIFPADKTGAILKYESMFFESGDHSHEVAIAAFLNRLNSRPARENVS